MKNLIQPVKGTRDFYPEEMAFRSWLYGKIKKVSERFGFQEFDGPEIEYLDLYADKTSQEILKDQVFTLKDRDNKTLVLRPEITPTFARMVAQKAQQLTKPIRWYSFGRAWRYEQPQKGRGREFFQWEINIFGPESPQADAEMIALAAVFFKEIGLSPDEVVIKVNDRSYFEQILAESGIDAKKLMPILRILDRKDKISPDEFEAALKLESLTPPQIEALNSFLQRKDYSGSVWLSEIFKFLQYYPGVIDYVQFDPTVARGFDYYTRTVFEAWDKTRQLKRALFGGGRFDNLTATLGGERIPGIGMAPGDMPIEVALRQFNKMPQLSAKSATVLVTSFSPDLYPKTLSVANRFREEGIDTESWPDVTTKLEKQLKYADQKGVPFVVIIGPNEAEQNLITLKDLRNKSQETYPIEKAIEILLSK